MPGFRFIYYSKFSCIWDDIFNFTSFACMHVGGEQSSINLIYLLLARL